MASASSEQLKVAGQGNLSVTEAIVLAGAPFEPKDADNGRAQSSHQSHDGIQCAVERICNGETGSVNSRWQRRAAFVRPAIVSFSRSQPHSSSETCRREDSPVDVSWEVVTTDLSPVGAGILSYSQDEPLPACVILDIDGARFDCDVRWTTRIGKRVYRYGLSFRDVQDNAPCAPPNRRPRKNS